MGKHPIKKQKTNISAIKHKNYNYSIIILLAVLMLIISFIRIRLLNIPLERDEGEYAYMGQLMLQGIPPYEIAYNMKFPGTYFMYAFFMSLFGQTIKGVHTGLLIMNLSSILLIFLLVKKILNDYAAIVSASAFAFLSISFNILGFAGHATHYVIVPAIAGTLFLYKAIKENKTIHYYLSGLLLGFAPLMKQPGFLFCIFGIVILIIHFYIHRKGKWKMNIKRFLLFALGGITPIVITFIVLKLCGVFDKFWFWTFKYAISYENQIKKLSDALLLFKINFFTLANDFYLIWIFAVLGIIALFLHPKLKKNFNAVFILLFFIFSFLSVCPGYYFRQHYFVSLLPAISILFGVFISYLYELSLQFQKFRWLKYLSYGLFIFSLLIGIYSQRDYLFKLKPNEISRIRYGVNPFVESVPIARFIKANSNDNDKIAILGSEPQICFYANRHSATGYIYTYGLMEIHENSLKMQKEMISEIEKAHPKFFIFVKVSFSWLVHQGSERYIFNWINTYLQNNKYQEVGVVDIYSNTTIYKWNDEVVNYQPKSDNQVLIFKRID